MQRGYTAYGANQWPAALPGMAAQCEAYIAALRALAQRLMQLMALSLDLPESYIDHTHDNPMITLRLLHYPPHPADADTLAFGAGAHTDWGAITLLAQDAHGGLEVCLPDGTWVAAPLSPGCFRRQPGRHDSALDQRPPAQPAPRAQRAQRRGAAASIPFFYSPDYEARVEPVATCVPAGEAPAFAPCTVGEHLREMYETAYGLKAPPPETAPA